MPNKTCSWGLCKNSSRKKGLEGIRFRKFPQPGTQKERCLEWIRRCGRPHEQLNLNRVGHYHYVCTEHFEEGQEDPVFAGPYTKTQKSRERKLRDNSSTSSQHMKRKQQTNGVVFQIGGLHKPSCCVLGCDYRSKDDGRYFHKFPWFNLKLLEQWLELLARDCNGVPWFPRKKDRVCSNHFHPCDSQEIRHSKVKWHLLSPTAVPSILPDVYRLKKTTVDDTNNFHEDCTSFLGGPQLAKDISNEPVTHIILNDDDIDQTGSFQSQDNETESEQVMRIQIPLVKEEMFALTRDHVQLCNTMRQLKEMAKVNLDLLYLSADVCKNQEARQEVEKVQDLINYLVNHSQVFNIEVYSNDETVTAQEAAVERETEMAKEFERATKAARVKDDVRAVVAERVKEAQSQRAKEAVAENLERQFASDAYEIAMAKREVNEACSTDGGLGDQNEDNDTNINQMDISPPNGNDCTSMIPSPAEISHSKQENDHQYATVTDSISTNHEQSSDIYFSFNLPNSYPCEFCTSKVYDNYRDLFIHLEREHGDQPLFTCMICNKLFTKVKVLRHHQRNHRKRGRSLHHLTCTVCPLQFLSPELLSIHENYHKKNSSSSHLQSDLAANYPCVLCDVKLQTETHFRRHLETKHSFFYTCSICSKQFKRLDLLRNHKRRQCAGRFHVCSVCSKHFRSLELFSSHQNYHKKHGSVESRVELPHADYPCEFCDVKLPTEADLRKHYETEPDHFCICDICSKPIKIYTFLIHRRGHVQETDAHLCPFCGRQFKWLPYLKRHIKFHEEKLNTQCTKCDITFESNAQLKQHKIAHEEKRPDVCPICGDMVNVEYLKFHIQIHNRQKKRNQVLFPCKYCSMRFRSEFSLDEHVNNKHSYHTDITNSLPNKRHVPGQQPFQCVLCDMKFARSPSYAFHVLQMHTLELDYCPVCEDKDSRFSSIDLEAHLNSVHLSDKPYKCTICGELFLTNYRMLIHRNSHTKNTGVSCKDCNRTFTTPYGLKVHRLYRHNKNPSIYECEVCGKILRNKGNLSRHRKTHSDVNQSCTCKICGKTFSCKDALKLHAYTHTTVKKYNCDKCSIGFNDKRALTSHMQKCTSEDSQIALAGQQNIIE